MFFFSFGLTLEPQLRRIFDRLDLKVKIYRSDSFLNIGEKKKLMELERNGIDEKGTSSEPTTHSSSEEIEEKAAESTTEPDDGESFDEEKEEILSPPSWHFKNYPKLIIYCFRTQTGSKRVLGRTIGKKDSDKGQEK